MSKGNSYPANHLVHSYVGQEKYYQVPGKVRMHLWNNLQIISEAHNIIFDKFGH